MPITKDDLLVAARRYEESNHQMVAAVAAGDAVAALRLAREMSTAAATLTLTALTCDLPPDWIPGPTTAQ